MKPIYLKHEVICNSRWLIFYKLFWIFVIMSVMGYLVEVLSFFVYDGHFVNRQGLIYGPVSEIYGLGAVLLIICMHNLMHKPFLVIFLSCTVIGGMFEYMNSVILERALGVVSWTYGKSLFTILGRTDLLNDVCWGLLGATIIKLAYPKFSAFFDRVISKPIIIISWILIVFFAFDIFITTAAIIRQTERHSGVPAVYEFQKFLDKNYPDALLKAVFPKTIMK